MAGWTSDACPHCGTNVDHGNRAAHERACYKHPNVRARILLALRNPDDNTRAVSGERYNARRSMFDAPSAATLTNALGNWTSVCAEFGLEQPGPYRGARPGSGRRKEALHPCPHCGKMLRASPLVQHERVCHKNPEAYARYRAALSSDVEGVGVAYAVYAERARNDYAIPDPRTLRRLTEARSWEAILAAFDLVHPGAAEKELQECPICGRIIRAQSMGVHRKHCTVNTQEAAAMVEVDDWYEQAREVLHQERYHLYGFTALRVHDAPGLTINGKPCQRIELR